VQFALNPALDVWKENYCELHYQRCVRYQNSRRNLPVPLSLLPNGKLVTASRSQEELEATVIFNAILKNRVHMVGSLIRAGVDVNIKNIQGMTPLMAAAEQGNNEAVKVLLKYRANPAITNELGETAFDIAMRRGHNNTALLLNPRAKRPPKTKSTYKFSTNTFVE